jgi:nucleoid DNA-binding protein
VQWDETLSQIAKEVADKYQIPTDQAKLLIETYCSCNLKAMRQYQPVIWVNIGKFYLHHQKTVKSMLRAVAKYRAGELTRKELEDRFDKMYPILMAARWHDPRDGKRYRFERFIEELEKEGKKYIPHKWWENKPEPCQEDVTLEFSSLEKPTIYSDQIENEEMQSEKRKPGDLECLYTQHS